MKLTNVGKVVRRHKSYGYVCGTDKPGSLQLVIIAHQPAIQTSMVDLAPLGTLLFALDILFRFCQNRFGFRWVRWT